MPFEYYSNFLTSEEEALILDELYKDSENVPSWQSRFSDRRMKTYGFSYIKGMSGPESMQAVNPIPVEFAPILSKYYDLTGVYPNQMTVNEYLPGQGIDPHYDHQTRFGNIIGGITLGGGCSFILKKCKPDSERLVISRYLEPKSLYVLSDSERYDWTHQINKTHFDEFEGQQIMRKKRVSCTFRTVINDENKESRHDLVS